MALGLAWFLRAAAGARATLAVHMWVVCAVWVGVRNVALVHSWWNLGTSLPTLLSILSPVWANFLIKANADGYGVPAGVKAGAANSSPTLHTLSACFSIFHSSLYFTCVGSEAVNTSNAMRLLAYDVTRPALSSMTPSTLVVPG